MKKNTSQREIIKNLEISKIRRDGKTQIRSGLPRVNEYAEIMEEKLAVLPPVSVVYDGTCYWLWDGFQRVAAAEKAGYSDIDAEVQQGTLDDAVLLACGANAEHGERRSSADKRRAVERLLQEMDRLKLSQGQIAEVCHVTPQYVSKIKQKLVASNSYQQVDSCVGKDGKVYHTENIGRPKPDAKQESIIPAEEPNIPLTENDETDARPEPESDESFPAPVQPQTPEFNLEQHIAQGAEMIKQWFNAAPVQYQQNLRDCLARWAKEICL